MSDKSTTQQTQQSTTQQSTTQLKEIRGSRADLHAHTRYTRRHALLGGVTGVGLLLRGLATGLPPAWLLSPKMAFSQTPNFPLQTLILSTSSAGDPVNANCPGTYVNGVVNNPNLAVADFTLGQTLTQAAQPWSTLPQALRDRLAFIHHRTRSAAHPEHHATLTFHGSVKNEVGNGVETLPSALALLGAPQLNTLQKEPIPLGKEMITIEGQPLQNLNPSEIKALFAEEEDSLADLRIIRDQTLNQLYAGLRVDGTRAQRSFLDRYLQSRDQARTLGEQLGDLLSRLPLDPDNIDGPADQIIASVALAKLKVAPVITLKIPFGGDNHQDSDLSVEADQTTQGVGFIGQLWDELESAQLTDEVTFAMLNVFGRNLTRNSQGGRNHNRSHSVMITFGAGVQAGVYGGVDGDGQCMGIDPMTGMSRSEGGIDPDLTMESAGKSLAIAMGHERSVIEERIQGGSVIEGALKTS